MTCNRRWNIRRWLRRIVDGGACSSEGWLAIILRCLGRLTIWRGRFWRIVRSLTRCGIVLLSQSGRPRSSLSRRVSWCSKHRWRWAYQCWNNHGVSWLQGCRRIVQTISATHSPDDGAMDIPFPPMSTVRSISNIPGVNSPQVFYMRPIVKPVLDINPP